MPYGRKVNPNIRKRKFKIKKDINMTCELTLFNGQTNKVLKTKKYDCNYSEGEEKVKELNEKLNKKQNNNTYWKLTAIYR